MRPEASLFKELAQDLLRKGESVRAPTLGNSMFPLIRSGCTVQVEPVEATELRLGDIVLYRSGEMLFAHRLVAKRQQGGSLRLITKGDAFSWRTLEAVAPEQVLGRVAAVRGRRGWKISLNRGWGRLLSLTLAVTWPIPQGLGHMLVKMQAGLARSTPPALRSRE